MKVRCYIDRAAAIRAGIDPPNSYVYADVDIAKLTPEQREELTLTGQDGNTETKYPAGNALMLNAAVATQETVALELDNRRAKRLTIEREKAVEVEELVQSWLAMSQPEFNEAWVGADEVRAEAYRDARLSERRAARVEYVRVKEEEKSARDRERVAREERAREERAEKYRHESAKWEADRAAWVAEHGSTRLQKALIAGYEVNKLYVTERAAAEYPDFILDYSEKADWGERIAPTETALDLETALKANGVKASIVWLKDDGQEHGYEEPFEACEAVIIEGYLGKYTLFKFVNTD